VYETLAPRRINTPRQAARNYKLILLVVLALVVILNSQPVAASSSPKFGDADAELIPLLKDALVRTEVSLNYKTGTYTYSYSITNPASNSADINCIEIDITRKQMTENLGGGDFTLQGSYETKTFNENLNRRGDWFKPPPMVPVGVKAPPEWSAHLKERGTVQLNYWEENPISPGTTQSGFLVESRGPPGIREIYFIPSWYFRVLGKKDTIWFVRSKNEKPIKDDFEVKKKTVGPTAPPTDSTGQFSPAILLDSIDGYIGDSVKLGWLNDRKLADNLRTQLNSIRGALRSNNLESVNKGFKKFLKTLNGIDRSKLSPEAYGLLSLNAQYLIARLPVSDLPPTILLELKAEKSSLNVGAVNRFTAKLTVNGKPLAGHKVTLKGLHSDTTEPLPVSPDSSLLEDIRLEITDINGRATFKYASKKEFAVTFIAEAKLKEGKKAFSKTVGAKWRGGPDLIGTHIQPPFVITKGGNIIYFYDHTKNIGNAQAGASITRHYMSDRPRGQAGARVWRISEHNIPPLETGKDHNSGKHTHHVPSDMQQGRYYTWTCVDADNEVIESNEVNNCGSHEEGIGFFGIMRKRR